MAPRHSVSEPVFLIYLFLFPPSIFSSTSSLLSDMTCCVVSLRPCPLKAGDNTILLSRKKKKKPNQKTSRTPSVIDGRKDISVRDFVRGERERKRGKYRKSKQQSRHVCIQGRLRVLYEPWQHVNISSSLSLWDAGGRRDGESNWMYCLSNTAWSWLTGWLLVLPASPLFPCLCSEGGRAGMETCFLCKREWI